MAGYIYTYLRNKFLAIQYKYNIMVVYPSLQIQCAVECRSTKTRAEVVSAGVAPEPFLPSKGAVSLTEVELCVDETTPKTHMHKCEFDAKYSNRHVQAYRRCGPLLPLSLSPIYLPLYLSACFCISYTLSLSLFFPSSLPLSLSLSLLLFFPLFLILFPPPLSPTHFCPTIGQCRPPSIELGVKSNPEAFTSSLG